MSNTYPVHEKKPTAQESNLDTQASVTMVTTPGNGSCGIGTYARDLLEGIADVDAETVPISQDDRSLRHFVGLAVQAARGSGDVIHVQHEYGLFRRKGSKYPGVMGVVFFPLLFLLATLESKSVIVTMHSVLKPDPDESSFSVRLYLLLMHKLLALGISHFVFLSPDCASKFLADIDLADEEYSVLSHGVNTDVPGDVPKAQAKREFGYEPNDDVIAIPGFIRPPKGHDIFVELARELPEYEFLIAGGARPKGEDFEYAERIQAEAPENVTITGVLDDEEYWTALSAPDLAVLPYRVVTQSGTFNSCATKELPVLANDVSYFRRIEAKWGAPETVDVENLSAFVERVRKLVESDTHRRQLAKHIRQFKRVNSFEQVGADHRRIYYHVGNDTITELREGSPLPESRPTFAACSAQRGVSTDD